MMASGNHYLKYDLCDEHCDSMLCDLVAMYLVTPLLTFICVFIILLLLLHSVLTGNDDVDS